MFFFGTFLQHLRPHGDADLAQVGFLQQGHQRAGLADAAADAQRQFAVEDGLVIGQLEPIELIGSSQLLLRVSALTRTPIEVSSWRRWVTWFQTRMSPFSPCIVLRLLAGVGDPVVVVGGANFVRKAVFQCPADADNKDGRIFLQDGGLAPLAGQVGIHGEKFFGVKECEFLGQAGIACGAAARGTLLQCEFSAPTRTFQIFLTMDFRKSRLRCSGVMTRSQSH